MKYVCPVCEDDPKSHSLKNIGRKGDVTYMYTCPAKATKYDDVNGIVEHYDGVLSEIQESWVWVFDGKGFDMKHLMAIQVGIQLAKLITKKHSKNLRKIVVINPTWHIKTVIELVRPFLTKRVTSLIQVKGKMRLKTTGEEELHQPTFLMKAQGDVVDGVVEI